MYNEHYNNLMGMNQAIEDLETGSLTLNEVNINLMVATCRSKCVENALEINTAFENHSVEQALEALRKGAEMEREAWLKESK